MRIITWNMKGIKESGAGWKVFRDLNPDAALLQEVSSIPKFIKQNYDIKFRKAVSQTRNPQRFGTAVFVKGKIIDELPLSSEFNWVNRELKHFSGNLISCIIQPTKYSKINAVSVYSPAWPIDTSNYQNIDITTIRLKNNPKLWVTEILWSALKNANLTDIPWAIGGDLNSSETFDKTWGSGNKEIIDRMDDLGLKECLKLFQGRLIPTFRNAGNGDIIHQIDHLFVTENLFSDIKKCEVGTKLNIFEKLNLLVSGTLLF